MTILACATTRDYEKPLSGSGLTEMVSAIPAKKFNDRFVFHAVEALEEGNLREANKHFNRAIKYDPQNPQLHFLNALTYQLRGSVDDAIHYETAEAGYLISMQFDPRNWMAAYQLGQLKFRQQRFREAQNAFAYGLLFAPENPEMLQALAVSSYYAQDLETALSAVHQVQQLRHNHPEDLSTAAMVHAALGEFENAEVYSHQLAKSKTVQPFQTQRLLDRINDWKRFYRRNPGLKLAQADSGESDVSKIEMDTTSFDSQADTTMGPSNSGPEPVSEDASDPRVGGGADQPGLREWWDLTKLKKGEIPKMALVDVVIIRSEELHTTAKGVNLMNGLQLTLTGDLFDFQRNRTTTAGVSTTDTEKKDASFKISLPSGGITYNLNIFNDQDDRNEVLARPTLVALDGKPSEFFSGAVFHVELDGVSGSEGTVTDVPVGLHLTITPKFLNQDTLLIRVHAERAFLENQSPKAGFSNFSQVSKTQVTANVVMEFEETLVLSGLAEKEDEVLKDGVPFLQDMPGVQYLFSHEDTLQFNKSVLILITPHKPRYTYKDGTEQVSRDEPPDKDVELVNLVELKSRPDWFKPADHLDSAFWHLKDGRLFKEFQSGDVKMEHWDDPKKIETKIRHALEFLYY